LPLERPARIIPPISVIFRGRLFRLSIDQPLPFLMLPGHDFKYTIKFRDRAHCGGGKCSRYADKKSVTFDFSPRMLFIVYCGAITAPLMFALMQHSTCPFAKADLAALI
jgi:hypothetical protein